METGLECQLEGGSDSTSASAPYFTGKENEAKEKSVAAGCSTQGPFLSDKPLPKPLLSFQTTEEAGQVSRSAGESRWDFLKKVLICLRMNYSRIGHKISLSWE